VLGHRAGSPAMVFVTVCIAQFMAPFMLTRGGRALPSLGRELGASAVQLGLVEQLYVLSVAMVCSRSAGWATSWASARCSCPGWSCSPP